MREVATQGPASAVKSYTVEAYAAQSATSGLAPHTIHRREPRPQDVQIEILFCGICHSDLHQVRNEWKNDAPTFYPCVPGHEIVGRVTKIGSAVKKFKEGDIAAVGVMVDSCRECEHCKTGEEQYCIPGATLTYNSDDKILGGVTYGGYSQSIVVDENYVLQVPDKKNLAAVAPLLCAGITTYSPLKHWKVGEGQKVGIVGLGGLGHMGVKLARAFGAHVVLFTTSPNKAADAKRLGADEVVISTNFSEMEKHKNSFHFILNCVPGDHDVAAYLKLLKLDGTLTMVGAPEKPLSIPVFDLIMGRRRLSGSTIGGIRETQEMLNFCAERGIVSEVEVVAIQQVNAAYERLLQGDVKYRFVIDMSSLR